MMERFINLWSRINAGSNVNEYYKSISNYYSAPERHYHNLNHIKHCLTELDSIKNLVKYFDAVEFALWYHDIIYNIKSDNNEKKSAELAKYICKKNNLSLHFSNLVYHLILATKHCYNLETIDEKLIVDIDLSILGQPEKIFLEYENNIRKEYIIYNDDEYRKGRIKVLKEFLNRDRIYITDYFYNKYEKQARENIISSIDKLK